MSAGELESGNAGEPAKLIRQRYREASDIIKKGRMSSLFINDLDAGAGRMGDATQYTVNNQVRFGCFTSPTPRCIVAPAAGSLREQVSSIVCGALGATARCGPPFGRGG